MAKFAQGRFALSISDRSGLAFPYTEMVREWNGAWVHISEFEKKQPQLQPRPFTADPQALNFVRPARVEPATDDILPNDPFTTASNTTLTVSFFNSGLQVDDQVRFSDVKFPVGGVSIAALQLETTLSAAVTASDTTISLTSTTNFPTSGFVMIESVNTDTTSSSYGSFQNEVIEYTGISGSDLTGCTRATSVPYRGRTLTKTTAYAHPSGSTVFGSFKVASLIQTSYVNDANTTVYEYNSFTITLPSAATGSETGGGFNCFVGPLNERP